MAETGRTIPPADTWQDLIQRVHQVGFLPLFRTDIPGFSAEELTAHQLWWSGDPATDPWFWREPIAESGEVAYGKLFARKAGFVSKTWFPVLANYRREGYDFDARWEDGKASHRAKKIMDCFQVQQTWTGGALKQRAGFGRNGEKNFDGVLTELQMQTYLVIRAFRCKVNRQGVAYGLPAAVYATPEDVWGYEAVTAAYREDPQVSWARIRAQIRTWFPQATETQLRRLLR